MILLEISALYKSFTYLLTYLLTYKPALQSCSAFQRGHEHVVKSTRRMAIANGTYVSFCNQPIGQNLATPLESRRYVVAFTRLRVEAFGYVKRV